MNPIINFFNGNFPLTISFYCILLVSVVGITTLLSRLCVILKEKAQLSDGVVAGVMLGAITSLPELVTCIASVFVHKTGSMGFGDIVGSNIFDIFVLAVCLLVCVWMFIKKQANQINTLTLVFTGVGTLFLLLAMAIEKFFPAIIFHGFNFVSIFVLMSYVTSLFFMTRNAKVKDVNEGVTEINQAKRSRLFRLSLRSVIILLTVVSLVLIACAAFLTFASESLIFNHWSATFGTEEKASFGGALLLGVVTSLPEIVCCINLCVHREYNMVIDTIVGSTTFNLSILTIANIVYACVGDLNQPMFGWNEYNIIQVIVSGVTIVLMILYLIFNNETFKDRLSDKQSLAINITILVLVILAYSAFLVLGFI